MYPKISSVLQQGATRDDNINDMVTRYGITSHPDQHPSVCSNSKDPPTQGKSHPDPHPPVNTNSDHPTTLGEDGSNEDANKLDRTKRSCENASDQVDENRNLNEEVGGMKT